jgi:hypothetical protein
VKNWLKTQPKNFLFSDGIKNLWTAGIGTLKSREITLKSDISFVSVYLQLMCFFEKSVYFLTYPLKNSLLIGQQMYCNYIEIWQIDVIIFIS